jgi:hypothetical protein
MPVNLNGSHNKATERPRQIAKSDLVQQLGLTEVEFDTQCAQWSVAIEAEYTAAQVAVLKEMFGKSSGQNGTESPARPIAPQSVKATQAQDSAAQTLNLAVQSKTEGLNEAAQRGATQAIEEVTTEFTAYANVLLQGTEAMTQAKAALREGLKQVTTQNAVTVDFSDFFHLNAPAQPVLEGDN